MQVSEIIGRVRSLVSDQDKVSITDRELIDWINDAVFELSRILEYKQRSAKTDVVYKTKEYDLSDNMIIIYGVKYKGYTLDPMNHNEFYQLTENEGIPCNYVVLGEKILLYPTPNENVTDGLEVFYLDRPKFVSSPVDYPDLPIEYHPRIVEYCVSQAYMKDAQFDAAANMKNSFNANAITHLGAKDGSSYPHIRSVMEYE